MDALKAVNDLINIFEQVRDEYTKAEATVEYCSRANIDLLHACEIVSFNASEGYRIAKKIKNNQIDRREAKELIEQLQPLVEALNKHQSLLKELKNVHATIEQTRGKQTKRMYTPRTDVIEL